jgi:hypothetical protein
VKGETGFYQRARDILRGELTEDEDKYLRAEFPSARDRTTALASTVGTAGSFLLALVAVVVAIASGVSEQSAKVITAGNAAATLAAGCTEDSTSAACTDQKVEQARQQLATAQARLEEIASLNEKNAAVGALVLAAFLLGIVAQFTTPVVPRTASAGDWNDVLNRYQLKRWMIIVSLAFQLVAVGVLIYMALDVLL